MKRLLTSLSLSLVLIGSASAAENDTFLLRGATIHTMAGRDIENGSILVRDGKIAGVGQNLAAPAGVRIIEGRGMQVYPGMIDSGTTVGLSEISGVAVTNDVQEVGKFNPELRASIAVNPDSEHIPVTRSNGITSVLALPDGPLISGQASLMHLDGWTTDQMEVKRSTVMHMRMPTVGGGGGRGEGRMMGARASFDDQKKAFDKDMADLNDFFEEARRYKQAKAAHLPDFKPDLKLEAMQPVIDGQEPVMVTAVRERAIRDAIAFSEKQKVRMILCQATEAYKVLNEIKAHDIPVVLGPVLALPLEDDDPYDRPATTPAELYKAGIKFSIATFSNEFSRNLPYQAAAAVAFGLPREEAMKSITVNAAQILGVASSVGTIEEGKFADLMMVDGDPLLEQTQVKRLFIKGRDINLDNKQKRLYEKYMNRPAEK